MATSTTSPVSQKVAIGDYDDQSHYAKVTAGGALTVTAPQAAATGGASYAHIAAGQATTLVKTGAGTLYAIVFNTKATATNVTTIYDNVTAASPVIGVPDAVNIAVGQGLYYGPTGMAFATGLTIVTATANGADMTVVYK